MFKNISTVGAVDWSPKTSFYIVRQSWLSLQNGRKPALEDIINSLVLIASENPFQKRDFAHKEPRGTIQQWKHPSRKERVFRKSLL